MNCLFCKIGAREIPAHIVYENDAVLAMLDIHPRARGHTMVIPKAHAETILAMPEESIAPVFSAVKAVTALLKKAFNPDGFTIGINQGKASGQAVDHVHIHIIPRWLADKGVSIHGVVDNPPRESLDETAKKIIELKNNDSAY